MAKINPYGMETSYGFKKIQISQGDIFTYPEYCDLLVLSAREYSYRPLKGTLIAALAEQNISVRNLAENAEIDWRDKQHVWLSTIISRQENTFSRIAGIEFFPHIELGDVQKRLRSLFGMILAAKYWEISIQSIAMPIIGANRQKIPLAEIIRIIAIEAKKALEQIPSLHAIYLIEKDAGRYQKLSMAFDHFLGRSQDDLSLTSLDEGARKKVQQIIHQVRIILNLRQRSAEDKANFLNIIHQLQEIDTYPLHNIRFQNRLLAELIANDLCDVTGHPKWKKKTLIERIDVVSQECGISTWTRSYWHIMRELGNESVHITDKHPNSEDMNILFRCTAEVVNTWKKIYQKNKE